MSNDIYSWQRRFRLANEKSALLSVLIGSWITSSGYVPVGNQSKGKRVITFRASAKNEPDYISAGLLFGELTHALRSILDNIAYSLVTQTDSSQRHNRHISYPIFDQESKFNDNVNIQLPGISGELLALIKSTQPFVKSPHNPQEDPLFLLHQADIWDKHRVPVVCSLIPNTFSYSFMGDISKINNTEEEIRVWISTEPVTTGAVVAKLKFRRPFQRGFTVRASSELQFKVVIEENYYSIKQISESMSTSVSDIINQIAGRT